MLYQLGINSRQPEQKENAFETCSHIIYDAKDDIEAIKKAEDYLKEMIGRKPSNFIGATLYKKEETGKYVKNFPTQNLKGEKPTE